MIRVLHFSDIHVERGFPGVSVRSFLNKRALGLANLRLRRGPHFFESIIKIEALALFMEEAAVDVCVCTGDYTALGTEPELRLAREVIDPLTKASRGFVTVPGNHDIYLPDAVHDRRFDRHFGDLLGSDLPELTVDGVWPQVRLFDDHLAIIAINSARPNPSLVQSSGRVSDEQVAALRRILDDPRVRGRFVLVPTHYALRRANGEPDRATHGLENAEAVIDALQPVERGLFVHGHVHWRYHVRIPNLRMDMCCAGSVTHAGREGLWVYDIGPEVAVATPGRFDAGRYVLEPEHAVTLGG